MSQKFTPVQRRILAMLSDGLFHSRRELIACIEDDQATNTCLNIHLTKIRKTLRLHNEDIVCCYGNRTIGYRWMALRVPSSVEE